MAGRQAREQPEFRVGAGSASHRGAVWAGPPLGPGSLEVGSLRLPTRARRERGSPRLFGRCQPSPRRVPLARSGSPPPPAPGVLGRGHSGQGMTLRPTDRSTATHRWPSWGDRLPGAYGLERNGHPTRPHHCWGHKGTVSPSHSAHTQVSATEEGVLGRSLLGGGQDPAPPPPPVPAARTAASGSERLCFLLGARPPRLAAHFSASSTGLSTQREGSWGQSWQQGGQEDPGAVSRPAPPAGALAGVDGGLRAPGRRRQEAPRLPARPEALQAKSGPSLWEQQTTAGRRLLRPRAVSREARRLPSLGLSPAWP